MSTRTVEIGVGVAALVVVGVALVGGRSPAPAERVASPRPVVSERTATEQPVAAPPKGEVGPIDSPWRRTALTTVHAAPPLGLDDLGAEAGGESSIAVDPFTGQVTLWERDVSLPGWPALRRARTVGDDSTGLFGRGWRSEVDATLHRDGDGFVLVTLDGLTRLRPAGRGVWLTELGEVQALVATEDGGYEVDDPAGRIHRFDRTGRLVEIAGELRLERHPGAVRLTGPRGEVTLELDAAGRAARAQGDRIDVRYAYEGDELVRVDGSARRTYRAQPAALEVGGPAGPLVVATVDERGCVTRLEAPGLGSGYAQTYSFERGVAEVRRPTGTWRYEAEGDGWRISTPAGPERATLDARGRVVGVSAAGGPFQPVARHEARVEAPLEAPRTPSALRARDDAGRVVVEVGPAGRTTFERDGAGRVRTRTDGAGRVVRAIRDRAGRVESITGEEGSEVAFEHDLAGRPVRAVAGAHALTFEWDAHGQQTAESGPDARLSWTYGPRDSRLTTPWGDLARGTDEAGRVATLASPAGTFRWEHGAQGRVVRVRAPNGVVTELGRDAAGRETTRRVRDERGRALLELATARDASGLATGLRRDGAEISLARDARGRLTRAEGAGLALTYAWSEAGDRLGAEGLTHDGAGRLVRRDGPAGETRYGWDDLGRLTTVERRATTGEHETVRYAYDGLGRLASRTTSAGTTRYVHADGQLLAELGPGERARVWIHGPGLDAPLAYGDRAVDGGATTWTYLHGDATETTLAYSDAAGARVAQAVVGPFGETVVAPGGDRPVLFAGRLVDPITGLVNLRARWYAPELGRFLDADPLGPDGGESPWLYCDGDPVERRDPLGLSPWSGTPECPTVWDRLVSVANTGVDLAARLIDAGRVAVADAVAHEQATLRDHQVALTRSGVLDPPGRERPTFSASTFETFCHDTTSAGLNALVDARQGGLALLHDAIAPDAHDTGATGAAVDGYWQAALGYGDAMRRAQEHHVRVVDLLTDDGHGAASAFAQTALVMVGEHLLPVARAQEAVEGRDLRHFVDTGDERRLTTPERVQRGIEVASELTGAGAGALATRAARAARAANEALALARARKAARAADEALDAARAGRATPHARPSAPSKGLAQALDAEAELGAAARSGTPSLEPDCVYVLDRAGQPVRIGNFVDDPAEVLTYLRKHPTAEVLVSNLEEAQRLKAALRHAPDLPERPRVFAGDDLAKAQDNFAANSGRGGAAEPSPDARGGGAQPPRDPPRGPNGLTPTTRPADRSFASRSEAFRAAKERAGVTSASQQPRRQWTVGNDPKRRGMPNYRYSDSPGSHGRYYEYDTPGGRRVVAEHTGDPNNPGPHFHAGQLNDVDEDFFEDRYVPVDGNHHYFYPE